MRRTIACGLAALVLSTSITTAPAFAQRDRRDGPPPPYAYWESRRDPPPGYEFHERDRYQNQRWDNRRQPPPGWSSRSWALRQQWLRRHGHDDDDHDAAVGLIVGVLLGFALGAAVVDSQDHADYARSRLNDPAWIAYCARRYASFDPYTGTYLGYDGLRHYCR